MATSRRTFLKKGAFASLLATAPFSAIGASLQSHSTLSSQSMNTAPNDPVSDFKIKPESQRRSLGTLTQATFFRQLHTPFHIRQHNFPGLNQTVQFTLTEVFDLKARNCCADTTALTDESFRLVFHASQTTVGKQATYTLLHETLGTFELFLVPKGAKGTVFEAVINRLHT